MAAHGEKPMTVDITSTGVTVTLTINPPTQKTGRPREASSAAPSVLEPYREYLEARFGDDPHVLGSVLFRELCELCQAEVRSILLDVDAGAAGAGVAPGL